jgi:hypothetical protein
MRLTGQNGDRDPQNAELRTNSHNRIFAELAIALRNSTEFSGHSVETGLSQLATNLLRELRRTIGDCEVKREQLSAKVWEEFSREITPFYLSLISPSTPEHTGFLRFENSIKAVYRLIREELLEGQHRQTCESILRTLIYAERDQEVKSAFPELQKVVKALTNRTDLDPSLTQQLKDIAEQVSGREGPFAPSELSDTQKMVASAYLCMPSVRGGFDDEIIQALLPELRLDLPSFPGKGHFPVLVEGAPPLPSSSNTFECDAWLEAPLSSDWQELFDGYVERGLSWPDGLGRPRLVEDMEVSPLPQFLSSILEQLPNETLETLSPLVREPAFRAACLFHVANFDWIVDHVRAFGAVARALSAEWEREVDEELSRVLSCSQVTLSSSLARIATECTKNMLGQLRHEMGDFLKLRLEKRSPGLDKIKPLVRAQFLWSLPRGDGREGALDQVLVLEEPNLLRLFCPYVPASQVTRGIIEGDRGASHPNLMEPLGHPTRASDRLLRFLIRNAQSLTSVVCLSPLESYPVDVVERPYSFWLSDQEVEGMRIRKSGDYLVGCGDFVETAQALPLTQEHRKAFAASLHADYVTRREHDAPDPFLRTPGLVARAIFPLECLRETVSLWEGPCGDLKPTHSIDLPAIPSPSETRDPRIALSHPPAGRSPETFLLRGLSFERFFEALGYSPEEIDLPSRSKLATSSIRYFMEELPTWRCFRSDSKQKPSFRELRQLLETKMINRHQCLDIVGALVPYTSDDTMSMSETLTELERLRGAFSSSENIYDVLLDVASWKEVAVGMHVLPVKGEKRGDQGESASFDRQMQHAFVKVSNEGVGAESYTPLDMLLISKLLRVDRYSSRQPISVTLSQSLGDLRSGKTHRTAPWMTARTVSLETHPYSDPSIYFLGSKVIRQAVEEHDIVRYGLFREQCNEVATLVGRDLVRSIYPSSGIAAAGVTSTSKISPLELFFRALATGSYEQQELDRLRPSDAGTHFPLLDARLYIEQIADSLEWIDSYDGSETRFSPYVREQIKEALRFDEMVEEIRRISRGCESHRNPVPGDSPESWGFLPKMERELFRHFARYPNRATPLTFLPTRGVIMELLGCTSGNCIRRLTNIARTYDEATAIAFVINEEFPLVLGGCLIFKGSLKGEPVLVIRGFNPVYDLLDRVSAGDFFEMFADYVADLAREGGFSAVVIPQGDFWHNAGTLRAPVFFHLQEQYGHEPLWQLDDSQVVNFNGLSSRNVKVVRRLV